VAVLIEVLDGVEVNDSLERLVAGVCVDELPLDVQPASIIAAVVATTVNRSRPDRPETSV